ncbi:MAG TPA: glycosyltransferase family 2 protein [Acidobacteriaceae bacterium]|nr:glycosyltransferase family 2 protein [Acidobacteriaceae bacterium]
MTDPTLHLPDSVTKKEFARPRTSPRLSIVVPCYNEAAVLPETLRQLLAVINSLSTAGHIAEGRVYLIDDGSTDPTWKLIEEHASTTACVHGIKLSRNCGHQRALLAGLLNATGDVVISIDADLQDDPSVIGEMLSAWRQGAEVVYGVRRNRGADTLFKRITAQTYYLLLRRMGAHLVFDHADYRLLSRPVIRALKSFKETNIFLRGLIPQLGFPTAKVYYDRRERFAGTSKYPLSRMLSLAIEGVTSFSDLPLQAITALGVIVSLASFLVAAWALFVKLASRGAVPGWTSTVVPLCMLGGVQLLCMGVIGQYLAKVYSETKSRPRFIIEKLLPDPHAILRGPRASARLKRRAPATARPKRAPVGKLL